jgi:hypothetical protein
MSENKPIQTPHTKRASKSLPAVRRAVRLSPSPRVNEAALLADLRGLIQSARQRVATVANATTTMLCWHVGCRLLKDNLQDSRAEYGKRILVTLSRELTTDYGRGFSYAEIARMIQFCQVFPDKGIVAALSQHWTNMNALPARNPQLVLSFAHHLMRSRWNSFSSMPNPFVSANI